MIALKRLLALVPVLLGITFITFFAVQLAPGDPVRSMAGLNPKMTAEARQKWEKIYGLDKPVLRRYADWLKRCARLDFGVSFRDGEKVTAKIGQTLPVTLLLNSLVLFSTFALGIPIGIWSAVHEGQKRERLTSALSLGLYSMPAFWLALVAVAVFSVRLRWLPVSGIHSLLWDDLGNFERVLDVARHLFLPVTVSCLAGLAGVSRYVKDSMRNVLNQPYIRTAVAKGLPPSRVLYRHALPNALLSVITLLGLSLPALLGGSVLLESIFSIPGMGRLFYESVYSRDYPVIMGILTLGAFLTLLGNWLADLAYALADPRIRVSGGDQP